MTQYLTKISFPECRDYIKQVHWDELLIEAALADDYDAHFIRQYGDAAPITRVWLLAVWNFLEQLTRIAICDMIGHDTVSYADGESGSEQVECVRCGWDFSCYH